MNAFDDVDVGESEPVGPADDAAVDPFNVAARKKAREHLTRDMEEFMKRGGEIRQIADNVRADPPRKPSTDYGSSPI